MNFVLVYINIVNCTCSKPQLNAWSIYTQTHILYIQNNPKVIIKVSTYRIYLSLTGLIIQKPSIKHVLNKYEADDKFRKVTLAKDTLY